MIKKRLFLFFILFQLYFHVHAADNEIILAYADKNLFDMNKSDTLGLSAAVSAETYTVFSPGETDNQYNHGAAAVFFKNKLYVQWQTSQKDEDAADTSVVYSISDDAKVWTKPITLAPQQEGKVRTSGGWWTNGSILAAYINVWPVQADKPRGGYVEYMISMDGQRWSKPKRVTAADGSPVNGIFEQDPHALRSGRIINAVHEQPGLIVSPWWTDDPLGITGWTKGRMQNLPSSGFVSRELEPSWFYRLDGSVVMIFRDQGESYKKLISVSLDSGESWSTPELTNIPDSRSKQSAGNLPDGTPFIVGNPSGNKNRIPLVIIISSNGYIFDKAFLLRSGGPDLQPLRYEGKYKRAGYSYPKSLVVNDMVYVVYATNKEDIQITRIPVSSLTAQ